MRPVHAAGRIYCSQVKQRQPALVQQSWLPARWSGGGKKPETVKVTRVDEGASGALTKPGLLGLILRHPKAMIVGAGALVFLPGLIFSTLAVAAKLAFWGAVVGGGLWLGSRLLGGGGGSASGSAPRVSNRRDDDFYTM